jgi:hypothetical protein
MKVVIRNKDQMGRLMRTIGALPVSGPLMFELRPYHRSKTREQENKFHAMCRDLAQQGIQWVGKARTAEEWKMLVKSAIHHIRDGETHVVAGLEGEVVELLASTSRWTRKDYSEAIEYMMAFGAEHGVIWRDE